MEIAREEKKILKMKSKQCCVYFANIDGAHAVSCGETIVSSI
jgi:hypothetical protein